MSSSATTTDSDPCVDEQLPPVHPGEILHAEFLVPLGLGTAGLAQRIGVPRSRVNALVKGRIPVSPDMAVRLGRLFGLEADYWLRLQSHHDREAARLADPSVVSGIVPIETPIAAE